MNEITHFISLCTPVVKKNLTIVTPEDLGQDFFLHIDPDKTPGQFIPQMPRSAAKSEDNTVARITVAPTIRGCIQGWARLEHQFFNQKTNGCAICILPFEYALKPTNKLVFDAEETGEHWLVAYNSKTVKYKPTTIGKLFMSTAHYTYRSDLSRVVGSGEIYMELTGGLDIRINDEITVNDGCYKLVLKIAEDKDDGPLEVADCTKIPRGKYEQAKNVSASMLDHRSLNIPIYNKW